MNEPSKLNNSSSAYIYNIPQNTSFRNALFYLWRFLLAAILCYLALLRLPFPEKLHHVDFGQQWAAGRLLDLGQNPYNRTSLERITEQYELLVATDLFHFFHPPCSFTLSWFLGQFDLALAEDIFSMVNLACIFILLGLLSCLISSPRYTIRQTSDYILLGLIFVFGRNVAHEMYYGNRTLLVITLFSIAVQILKTKSPIWQFAGALVLSLTGIKPNTLLLVYALFFLHALTKKNWSSLTGFMFGALLQILAVFLIRPSAFIEYLDSDQTAPSVFYTPSAGGIMRYLFEYTGLWLKFVPLAFVAAIVLWASSLRNFLLSVELPTVLWMGSVLSVFLAPYAWTYEYLMYIPASFFLLCQIRQTHPRSIASHVILITLLILEYLIGAYSGSMFYTLFYPFVFIPVFYAVIYSFRRELIKSLWYSSELTARP